MLFSTMVVVGGIAALVVLLAGVLMRLDTAHGADVSRQPVTARQARFPHSIRWPDQV
jgi:hypothetical protein